MNKKTLPYSLVKRGYLEWHKTLKPYCFCMDIDSLECRKVNGEIKPVAIIEIQNTKSCLGTTYTQKKIYPLLMRALEIPLYIVRTDESLATFKVRQYGTDGGDREMTQDEYAKWLESL